jgi:hypothetical protein
MRILMGRRGSLGEGRLFLLDEIEGLIRGLVVLLYGIKVKAQDYNCLSSVPCSNDNILTRVNYSTRNNGITNEILR